MLDGPAAFLPGQARDADCRAVWEVVVLLEGLSVGVPYVEDRCVEEVGG